MSETILYGYWRSSATYRTRIALNLKGLAYDAVPVDLGAAEQRGEAYLDVNSQGMVPTLEIEGRRIHQSLAIIEWLDERFPTPPLLPLPRPRATPQTPGAVPRAVRGRPSSTFLCPR